MRRLLSVIFGAGPLAWFSDMRLEKHFAALDQASPGLMRKTVAFVGTGDGSSVLSTLGTPAIMSEWKSRPGRYGAGPSPVVHMLADGGADLDVLVRFGQVMAALDPLPQSGHWGTFGTKNAPDWFRHAVSRDAGNNRTKALCSVDRLASLAVAGGADIAAVLDVLFHPGPGVPYGTYHSTEMFGGVADWLGSHVALVTELQSNLDAPGRVELANAIGRFDVAERYLKLLVEYGTSIAKTVRAAAMKALTAAPREALIDALNERYSKSNPGIRAELVTLAVGALGTGSATLLERWDAGEKEKRPKDALTRALGNVALGEGPKAAIGPWEHGYVALDGSTVAVPARQPLPEPKRLPDAVYDLFRPSIDSYNANLRALREAHRSEKNHWSRTHQLISEADLAMFRGVAEGRAKTTSRQNWNHGMRALQWANQYVKWDASGVAAFFASPELSLRHLIAIIRHDTHWNFLALLGGGFGHIGVQELQRRIKTSADFQIAADLWVEMGGNPPAVEYLQVAWQASLANVDREILWPQVAGAFDAIDEALGLAPQKHQRELQSANALDLLETLPKVPHRYMIPLMTIATGSQKTLRSQARNLLSGAPDIDAAIIDLLGDGKQEARAGAADWLAARGTTSGIPAMRKTLKKEKSEIARAAIITALQRLGDDVSDCFDPDGLLKDAEAGLAKASAKGLEWFPFDLLPRLRWQDGSAVDPRVVRWWVVLANKLKQPGSNALLDLWLEPLAKEDARRFSLFVLQSWIEHDTRRPTEADANAHAAANVDAILSQNQQAARQNPRYAEYYVTDRDKLFAMLKRTKMSEYFGSASDSKGILALATQAEGADAAALVRSFLKDHGARISQDKALLEVLAANASPAAIQVVLSTANRFKARTVQEHAAALIERIAERRGWTPEELADRTIPTAGLDERGVCELDCGEGRAYQLVLDAQDALVLLNAAGQPVKALPAPRNDDEKPLILEAKKQVATARKELKQAVKAQTERLYEAMCLERRWSVDDWAQYLLRHPIVGRLVRRSVWIGIDGDGKPFVQFRPLDDGTLSDVNDGDIALGSMVQVQLAHASLVTAGEAAAWRAHLADYEVTAPFAQFEEDLPMLAESDGHDIAIDDRLGWMIETFKLRGAANKAGFVRSAAEDGGVFTTYERRYESAKIIALIEFTGSPLPEENIPAALRELRFVKLRRGGWHGNGVPLKDVPSVLLAESWKSLHRIAAAGTGFDPAWEKKAGW
ncbi:protein of unknown function [Sphingomonas sp. NFR04]|uniref:DUF4132 domain-containing protein n=1 Tax=Sphingomonas sp. NFR04 TaxID=1566283 RepID=UPI0008E5B6A1|nr:DUF4132 domain-containing protein [Sphingomonas sp. NFR04]SFJ65486.1 protein of unknown function [Sphingomonas sp. NFR04]